MILIGLIVFALSLFINHGRKDGKYKKALVRAGLVAYIFLVLAVTLLERTSLREHRAEWIPLWSWVQVFSGQRTLLCLEEIFLNIALFIPLGCLLSLNWNISAAKAVIIGFALSATIEITQYILCLGFFEWDDMIHNSLGCMLGTAVINWIRRRKEL